MTTTSRAVCLNRISMSCSMCKEPLGTGPRRRMLYGPFDVSVHPKCREAWMSDRLDRSCRFPGRFRSKS